MFGTLRGLVGVPSGLGEPAKVEARKLAAVPNRLGLCHVRPLQLRDALGLAALQAFALVRVFKARACLPEGQDRLVSDAARAATSRQRSDSPERNSRRSTGTGSHARGRHGDATSGHEA